MVDQHLCASSSRLKGRNASKAWVAQKASPILRNEPNLGAKVLQTRLQDTYKVSITYDTAWKGLQLALKQIYGDWDGSFSMLYRWKAEVLQRSPNSVIEIDTVTVDGKVCVGVWDYGSALFDALCDVQFKGDG